MAHISTAAKIACRTVGTVGMGIALMDACKVGKAYSEVGKNRANATYYEKAYFNSRTTDVVSPSASAISEKTFELRTKNPLPGIIGKIKGGAEGFLYGIGNFLPAIAFSSLALLGKSWGAKLGAIGVGLGICFKIAREGFGLGKHNPMT